MKRKKMFPMLVLMVVLSSALAFGNGKAEQKKAESDAVTLRILTPYVGTHASAPFFEWVYEEFSAMYGDTIKLDIEEVPGDQNYVDKIKILLSANQLPDVVFSSYNLLNLCVAAEKVVDLTPYLEADSKWKNGFDPDTLKYNTFEGKVMGVAYFKRLIGYYYNKDLFAKAGIVNPADTFDEFFAQMDQLKAAGITPMSLDTGDTGWISSLWLSSLIGTSGKAGEDFMNTNEPLNYETPEFINAVFSIQRMLRDYTTKDAIGGMYANGAVNFLSGKTAIMANGTWMIKDFSDTTKAPAGFASKLGVSIYPGKGVFMSPAKGSFSCSGDKVHADAAVKFLQFLTSVDTQQVYFKMTGESPESPKVELTDDIKAKYPLVADLYNLSTDAEYRYQYPQAVWYANVTDQLSLLYPSLAQGDITPAGFAAKLSETAKKNQ